MSMTITDNGGGMVSFHAVGSIIRTGIVRQSINKKTGKLNEYVELVVAFRPKQYEDDVSCNIVLRVYSKALSTLAMRLKKGWNVVVDGNTNATMIDMNQNNHQSILGFATMIEPVNLVCEMYMDWIDRIEYTKSVQKRAYEINYSGGMDSGPVDADF